MKKKGEISLASIMSELQKMDDKFNKFTVVDKEWKDNSDKWKTDMEEKISPIIRERNDYTIIMKWWSKTFHIIAIAIAFILSLNLLIQAVISYIIKR